MSPATGTALLLLVAFVVPGFVAILIKERLYEVPAEQHAFERLLQTLYYSLLVYAVPVVAAVALGEERDDFTALFRGRADARFTAAVAVAVLILLPLAIAYAGRRWTVSRLRPRILDRLHVNTTHRTPSSWDYTWADEEPCLVVVTLRSGGSIAGYYGRASHSGYGSRQRDLFLEQRWDIIEGGGATRLEPIDDSLGIWLAADEIVSVERYPVSDAQLEEVPDNGAR